MQLSNAEIQEILPHRYPFLLVDKVVECEPGKYAKGIKCVTVMRCSSWATFLDILLCLVF